MEDASDQQKLSAAVNTLSKIDATLAKLYEKTAQTTSFGDQSRTLASIEELEKSRDKYKLEIAQLKAAVYGKRRTLKMQFRKL